MAFFEFKKKSRKNAFISSPRVQWVMGGKNEKKEMPSKETKFLDLVVLLLVLCS